MSLPSNTTSLVNQKKYRCTEKIQVNVKSYKLAQSLKPRCRCILTVTNRFRLLPSAWVVSTFFTMTAQRFLSVPISGLMPYMRMSLFSLSSHLIFGRPPGRVPVTVVRIVCFLLCASRHVASHVHTMTVVFVFQDRIYRRHF